MRNNCVTIFFPLQVSCFEWSSYIKAKDCVDQALVNNGWSSASDLTNMSSAEKKTLLVSKLSFYYDGEIHSEFALANRKESSDVGSLCGLAAVYQAAVDTILTVFQVLEKKFRVSISSCIQLKAMSYKDVKVLLHETMGLDPVAEKISSDVDLLEAYFFCELKKLSVNVC